MISPFHNTRMWNPADMWMVRKCFDYDTFKLSYAKGRVNSEF